MKTLIIATLMVLSFNVSAANSKTSFSVDQLDEILTTIDNTCGDTWCEGDYNYNFKSFKCKDSECALTFQFISTDDNDQEKYSKDQKCVITNIKTFKDMKDGLDLNQNFADELGICFSKLEKNAI